MAARHDRQGSSDMDRPLRSIAVAACLALGACGGGSNNSTAPLTGELRVVNGIPESDGLDSSIDNVPFASGTVFHQASGINSPVPEGSYNAQFTVTSGSSSSGSGGSASFTVDNVAIAQNQLNTVFTAGTVEQNNLTGFPAPVSLAAPASGQFAAQFVNGALSASNGASLNFYVVAPGTTVGSSTTPAATLAYGAYSQPLAYNSGSYELVVTDSGGGVLYDSGSSGVPLPPNGNVLQIAVLDNLPPGLIGCALFLTILDNLGNQTNPPRSGVCPG
jgi:hypothetical protein